MESADVELRSKLPLRLFAQFQDRQLPCFVCQRLRRPCDVPVGLALNRRFVGIGVVVKEVHDLIAGPVLVMKSGVDD